jgi:hypothetical protein
MLMRCAARTMGAPVALGAGLMLATGLAAVMTIGAGALGAGLLARRFREERQGWRDGAADAPAGEAPKAE